MEHWVSQGGPSGYRIGAGALLPILSEVFMRD